MKLRGARVLITGATGGIGGALADEFAARGARLVLSGRNEDALRRLAEQLPGPVELISADLSTPERARELAEQAGAIDVLMSNAAVEAAQRPENLTVEQVATAINVNFTAPSILARVLGEGMLARGRGHIAFMASAAGCFGGPGPIYIATKWGLRGLALSLSQEWAAAGIGVSIIHPGAVRDVGMIARGVDSLSRKPPRWARWVTARDVAVATADAIEAGRVETVVADPILKAAIRLGGLAPVPIAKALCKSPAIQAFREAMVQGSVLTRTEADRSPHSRSEAGRVRPDAPGRAG